MAQTKLILDSNSYFRLAQNIHPLLSTPFGEEEFTLYIHADLNAEFRSSFRLKTKFHWLNQQVYADNRKRSLSLSNQNKKDIDSAYEFMWQHVQEEFLEKKGTGPSQVDTRIVATAFVLGIEVVTDDADMIELILEYDVGHLTSLGLMKRMLDCEHIDDEKIDQVVDQWMFDDDTPNGRWRDDFEELFDRDPPEPSF